MSIHTINDDVLNGDDAARYFQGVDRRIQIGFRAALELLGVPLPGYAYRKPAGPKSRLLREIAEINGEPYRPERSR